MRGQIISPDQPDVTKVGPSDTLYIVKKFNIKLNVVY